MYKYIACSVKYYISSHDKSFRIIITILQSLLMIYSEFYSLTLCRANELRITYIQ